MLNSNALAIVCTLIWVTAFEPLLKFVCGRIARMQYEYGISLRDRTAPQNQLWQLFGNWVTKPTRVGLPSWHEV